MTDDLAAFKGDSNKSEPSARPSADSLTAFLDAAEAREMVLSDGRAQDAIALVGMVRAVLAVKEWVESQGGPLDQDAAFYDVNVRAALLSAIPGDRPGAGSPGEDRTSDPQPPTPTAEAVGRNADPLPRQSLRDGQETR